MPKPRSPVTKDRERSGRGKGRYIPKRRVCPFCAGRVATINYKDVPSLRRYISDRGRIEPRRRTGVCAKHQRTLSVALKRARHIALLPYTSEHIRQSAGPNPRERSN
jgi:small subunit ribosomal protein S18